MYSVKMQEKYGTCDNTLLEKMLKKGDVQFIKLKDIINENIEVTGYCRYVGINTNADGTTENEYLLVATQLGYIRTGSTVFIESFRDYIDEVTTFAIREIQCKKGTSYKPEPVI